MGARSAEKLLKNIANKNQIKYNVSGAERRIMNNKMPIRKQLRLEDYDYSQQGTYFITICVKNRLEILGNINDNEINLAKEGIIAKSYIETIEKVFEGIILDEYVIMPNHIHAIISIVKQNKVTLSRIINQYKGAVTKQIGYSIWQKSYYEHIIRNEKEYYKIKEYIQNNIINWKQDEYF